MRTLIALALLCLSGMAQGQAMAPCLPKVQYPPNVAYGTLPAGVSTLANYWAAYVCTQPGGYVTMVYLGALSEDALNIVDYIHGTYSFAQASLDFKAQARLPTATEQAFIAMQMATYRPRAVVAFNGASVTRSVYTTNPDGTLNATPVPRETVAVAAPCNEAIRIPTAPSYYSVSGQANATGGTLPAGSFTICVVSFPIGTN